ncbi:MAG: hypothetical protein ACI8VW_001820 [bacterium]
MKDDSYEAKLERAEYELYVRKIGRKKSHPLLYKLLRLLRIKVRPPHYATPASVFVFCSFYIAILAAALLVFLQKDSQSISVVSIVVKSVPVGMVFGLIMMLINIDNTKNYKLTPWEDI